GRGELRGVGDDRDPPHDAHEERQPWRAAEGEADEHGAETAQGHRGDRQGRAAPGVGDQAADVTAEGTEGDDQERRAARVQTEIATAAATLETLAEKHADPGPHGVELPHVAEIAEAGEARAAVTE